MNEQIRTAAELDALPDSSVLLLTVRLLRADQAAAAIKRDGKWYLTGVFTADGHGYTARDLMDDTTGPLAVLYCPDAPAHTEPTEEQVLTVLRAHGIECTGLGEVTCVGCRSAGWMTWGEYRLHLARAVLALLPQRVAPSEEEIAKAILMVTQGGGTSPDYAWSVQFEEVQKELTEQARDVAALFGSQPTVAEVRAQAVLDAAAELQRVALDNPSANPVMVLRARAERGEA